MVCFYFIRFCYRCIVFFSRFYDFRKGYYILVSSSIYYIDRRSFDFVGLQYYLYRRIYKRSLCSQYYIYKWGFFGCCYIFFDCCNSVYLDSQLFDIWIYIIQVDIDRLDWFGCIFYDLSRFLDFQDSFFFYRIFFISFG